MEWQLSELQQRCNLLERQCAHAQAAASRSEVCGFFVEKKTCVKSVVTKTGWWFQLFPSLPKSSKYLVNRCLELLNVFSGAVWGSKHLLTRYLEDWGLFYSHPYLGKMDPFWLIFFQRGWNHQLEKRSYKNNTPLKVDFYGKLVGKYTSLMDGMGIRVHKYPWICLLLKVFFLRMNDPMGGKSPLNSPFKGWYFYGSLFCRHLLKQISKKRWDYIFWGHFFQTSS